jgi:hypothetical protein
MVVFREQVRIDSELCFYFHLTILTADWLCQQRLVCSCIQWQCLRPDMIYPFQVATIKQRESVSRQKRHSLHKEEFRSTVYVCLREKRWLNCQLRNTYFTCEKLWELDGHDESHFEHVFSLHQADDIVEGHF